MECGQLDINIRITVELIDNWQMRTSVLNSFCILYTVPVYFTAHNAIWLPKYDFTNPSVLCEKHLLPSGDNKQNINTGAGQNKSL